MAITLDHGEIDDIRRSGGVVARVLRGGGAAIQRQAQKETDPALVDSGSSTKLLAELRDKLSSAVESIDRSMLSQSVGIGEIAEALAAISDELTRLFSKPRQWHFKIERDADGRASDIKASCVD